MVVTLHALNYSTDYIVSEIVPKVEKGEIDPSTREMWEVHKVYNKIWKKMNSLRALSNNKTVSSAPSFQKVYSVFLFDN